MTQSTNGRKPASKSAKATGEKEKEMKAEIETLKKDMSMIADRLAELTSTSVERAKETGDKATNLAQEKLDQVFADLNKQLTQLERDTTKTVRNNPLQSLGVAAGVGFLLAVILRR